MADVRRAVRDALDAALPDAREGTHRQAEGGVPGKGVVLKDAPLVLVALSGGPDSLALAVALGFEQAKCGVRAGAIIVDHGLQEGSAEVAERAAEQVRAAGLNPVLVRRVAVTDGGGGPEADARAARYAAFADVARETHASAVLIGHTLDDQAETVLLGLARGSGARSLAGMRVISSSVSQASSPGLIFVRPLLGLRRDGVAQSLADQGIEPWHDPQNADPAFSRVRVRASVLPLLEAELGPGVAQALARTATQLTDDADYLDALAAETFESSVTGERTLSTEILATLHPAIRIRCLRIWLVRELDPSQLSAAHLAAVDELVTNWRGQHAIDVPGGTIVRHRDTLCAEPIPQGTGASL
jgi:tRNA(Ile)-lysidine synthase